MVVLSDVPLATDKEKSIICGVPETVIATRLAEAELPALSAHVAPIVWPEFARVLVWRVIEYGPGPVISAPYLAPSPVNCTVAPPTSPVQVAVKVIVPP